MLTRTRREIAHLWLCTPLEIAGGILGWTVYVVLTGSRAPLWVMALFLLVYIVGFAFGSRFRHRNRRCPKAPEDYDFTCMPTMNRWSAHLFHVFGCWQIIMLPALAVTIIASRTWTTWPLIGFVAVALAVGIGLRDRHCSPDCPRATADASCNRPI